MIRNIRAIGLVSLIFLSLQIAAQNVSRTSYFMDNATHRHLMNPALASARGYLAIPVAGQLFIGTESNLELANYIYPAVEGSEGKPITFLHPSIKATDFLNTINEDQYFRMNLRTSILSFGQYIGSSGFITFDVATRIQYGLNLPKDFFAFAKQGMSSSAGNTYHFDNLSFETSVIGEAGLGYSVNVTDALRLGVKAKFLAGGTRLKATMRQMELRLTPDSWSVSSQGQMDVYGKGITYNTRNDGEIDLNSIKLSNPGLGGIGGAVDAGFEWAPVEFIHLSASVVDFGRIKWSKSNIHSGETNGTVSFSGINGYNPDSTGEKKMDDQMDDLSNQLKEMIKFKNKTVTQDFMQKLNPAYNVGLELTKGWASLGGLYSTRLIDSKSYTEITTSLNLKPLRSLNLSGSYSLMPGDQKAFGFALGFAPRLFNLFISCDYIPDKWAKYKKLPVFPVHSINTNFQIGLSIPLSKRPVPVDPEEDEDVNPDENPENLYF